MYKSTETEKQNKYSKVGRIKMKVARLPSYSCLLAFMTKENIVSG